MDFGFPGSDCITGHANGAPSQAQPKLVGSGFPKQERCSDSAEDHRKCSKMQRSDDLFTPKTMPLRSNSGGHQEHMLSFSSLKSEPPSINKDGDFLEMSTQNSGLFYFQHTPQAYARSAGSGCGSMHEGFNGFRGPLTPTQLTELQHQALIYKYITCNVAVPSNLIIPLKNPFILVASPAHLLDLCPQFITDPEPGRCRRTDGKKWRCSRDAVPDQKYCERHINRGRHRSRKPVEGQTGHAASGTANLKAVPMSSPMSASVITSSSLRIAQQHRFKNLQSGAIDYSLNSLINSLSRDTFFSSFLFKVDPIVSSLLWVQDPPALSVMSSTTNLKSNNSTFTITKQGVPFADSSQSDFGHVTFDSLVNLSHRSSIMDSKECDNLLDFTTSQETQDQNPLHRFIDDWPKDESISSIITWPGELRTDWTQLSMSIPITSSEFSSSSSSPAREKLALSPLRLSREFDPIQTVVNCDYSDPIQNQAHWIPISWGCSMGGPLGEVLTNTPSNTGSCKNSSPLSLLSEGWSSNPHSQSPVPIGVSQMAPFGSLSNSSSGSSPISENKKLHDGSSLCDDVLGSTLVSYALIPSVIRS
ncbi:Growth-regulating factor 1, putative isoform 2 [Hibiscus syriacus]|uniref:Growth-regulating factor n=1 Tax=Hibiscus syriacus TaxID=106335 RepID=A0A6A3A861_HIBSY|nr:Growth-regulating factor 1, putative isoform 2 [Hibiscus syriacus]